jgi:hypothetical protein
MPNANELDPLIALVPIAREVYAGVVCENKFADKPNIVVNRKYFFMMEDFN